MKFLDCQALAQTRKRKLGNNTYLTVRSDGSYGIRLHDTEIIIFHKRYAILNSGGWRTVTTKARMNEFANNWQIHQAKGIWYINNKVYADHCKVYPSGHIVGVGPNPKDSNKLRNRANAFAKAYIYELFIGNIKAPTSGDCWHCLMFDRASGKISSDHILAHIKEKYYVPSLVVNAIKRFPISRIAEHCMAHFWQGAERMESMESCAKRQIQSSLRRYLHQAIGQA